MKRFGIMGLQFGDEGKGKMTDYFAQKVDMVVRYQGGDNAGHTVKFDDQTYDLHVLPSGIIHSDVKSVMATGMVINMETLIRELKAFPNANLYISDRAHLILPFHKLRDQAQEKTSKIGTTLRGIGPAYQDKVMRRGIRVASLLNETRFVDDVNRLTKDLNIDFDAHAYYESMKPELSFILPKITNTSKLITDAILNHERVMFEGAQGVMLCVDHGTYPYVTSSSPTTAAIPLYTGIAPWLLDGAIGIMKAYTSRVGEGPFPTEMEVPLQHIIREKANEYGTTTKRPRRIGYLDAVMLKYAVSVSGVKYVSLMLADILNVVKPLKIAVGYELHGEIKNDVPAHIDDLYDVKPIYQTFDDIDEELDNITSYDEFPHTLKEYIRAIEAYVGVKVAYVSVGPKRHQTITILDIVGNDHD
jgi:adenylosuccinate synthase